MFDKEEVKELFAAAQAIITDDHFVYAEKPEGFFHGSAYVNKDAVYPHRSDKRPYNSTLDRLCQIIATEVRKARLAVDVVVSPEGGAYAIAQRVADYLTCITEHPVIAIYANKMPGGSFDRQV